VGARSTFARTFMKYAAARRGLAAGSKNAGQPEALAARAIANCRAALEEEEGN